MQAGMGEAGARIIEIGSNSSRESKRIAAAGCGAKHFAFETTQDDVLAFVVLANSARRAAVIEPGQRPQMRPDSSELLTFCAKSTLVEAG